MAKKEKVVEYLKKSETIGFTKCSKVGLLE
jgi:uncharacterized protein YehS (DUF1456 family)